jgi:hypothetical protein
MNMQAECYTEPRGAHLVQHSGEECGFAEFIAEPGPEEPIRCSVVKGEITEKHVNAQHAHNSLPHRVRSSLEIVYLTFPGNFLDLLLCRWSAAACNSIGNACL